MCVYFFMNRINRLYITDLKDLIFYNIFSETIISVMAFTRIDYHLISNISQYRSLTLTWCRYYVWPITIAEIELIEPLRRLAVSIIVHPTLYASNLWTLLIASRLIKQYWYSSQRGLNWRIPHHCSRLISV